MKKNKILSDNELSLKAKGMYFLLLSLGEDANASIQKLQEFNTDKVSSIRTSLDELIGKGYIERVMVRDKGKFVKTTYNIAK